MDLIKQVITFLKLVKDSLNNALPRIAYFQVTRKCCCQCMMCELWKHDEPDPPLVKVKEIITSLKELGVDHICLWGGEPYLRDDIISIFEFIKSENLFCSVITNGLYISREVIDKNVFLLDKMVISIDSTDERIHDTVRQKEGMLKMTLQTIDEMCRSRRDPKHPEIILDCTLQALNIDHLDGLIDLASRYDLPLELDPVQLHGLGNHNDSRLVDIPPEKVKHVIDSLKMRKIKKFNSAKSLGLIEDYLLKKPIDLMCLSPYIHLLVEPSGDVSFCWGPEMILGNVLDGSFPAQ